MTLGEQFKARRKRVKLGLREMARKLKVSAPYLWDFENGNRAWSDNRVMAYDAALRKTEKRNPTLA